MTTTMFNNLKSLTDTSLVTYYKTKFGQNDVRASYEAQSLLLQTSYNKTRLSNLTVSPEILSNIEPFDIILNASCMIINGRCMELNLLYLLEHVTSTSTILLNIPSHYRFIEFWFSVLKNTNATVWTSIARNSYQDVLKSSNARVLECIPLESMFNFSRELFVPFDLIQLQFFPSLELLNAVTVELVGRISGLSKCTVSCDFMLDRITNYLMHLLELKSGDLAFHFLCEFFSAALSRMRLFNSLKDHLIHILRKFMMSINMELDPSLLSINGVCSIIRDVALNPVGGHDFDLVIDTFRYKYALALYASKPLSLYSSDDFLVMILNAVLCCFSINDESVATLVQTYGDYTNTELLSVILKRYRKELLLSLDIGKHLSLQWRKGYTGEGFVSLLVALYMSRFPRSEFVLSYLDAITLMFDTGYTLYCGSEYDHTILTANYESFNALDLLNLYIEDSDGSLSTTYNDRHFNLKTYTYVHSPSSCTERDNNFILEYIATRNIKALIRCKVFLTPESEFCNKVLDAGLTVSSMASYTKADLIPFHNLATYFCYFPRRTFPREVMYYGCKTDSFGLFTYYQSFESKFTNISVRYSDSPSKLIFKSKYLGTSEFTSWYYRGNIYENCGNAVYKYSVSYPKLPLKIEEYVQHKHLGYVSPLKELNVACYNLIATISSLVSPPDGITAYADIVSKFKLSSHLSTDFLDFQTLRRMSRDEYMSVCLCVLQSLFNRHSMTSLINDAYKGTGHLLIVRPLILMAHQSEASSIVKTAAGDNFNMHHSLLTDNGKVEYVCRTCGNIGTSQYIVRICEFINSMDASSLACNFRLNACYPEYLDYDVYNSHQSLSIKALRSLRSPTEFKTTGIVLTNSCYSTSSFKSAVCSVDNPMVTFPDISSIPTVDMTCFNLPDFFSVWARSSQPFSIITPENGYGVDNISTTNSALLYRRTRWVQFYDTDSDRSLDDY